jgi:8-oxo-dGTP pyrophosphatase MutT (NUDIX family)
MLRIVRTSREAAVFVYRDNRLLLLRRVDKRYWHVVAGVVDEGESERDAAIRELREETGLAVNTEMLDLELRQTHPVPDDIRSRYPPGLAAVTVANFAVEAPRDWEPILNEEHDAYRWCSFDDAGSSLFWPLAREALGELARRAASLD